MSELEAKHIYGSAQVAANLATALHALREASSGYLALACGPERTVYAPTAEPVFDTIGQALHGVLVASDLLNTHLIAVTNVNPR